MIFKAKCVTERETGTLKLCHRACNVTAALITDTCNQEKIQEDQLVLHSDNGGPMKAFTMLAKLESLGVKPSFSRPRISNDNPYSESLFRTMKYRPEYPEHPFEDLKSSREWAEEFSQWYNNEHLHSGICFVREFPRNKLPNSRFNKYIPFGQCVGTFNSVFVRFHFFFCKPDSLLICLFHQRDNGLYPFPCHRRCPIDCF